MIGSLNRLCKKARTEDFETLLEDREEIEREARMDANDLKRIIEETNTRTATLATNQISEV